MNVLGVLIQTTCHFVIRLITWSDRAHIRSCMRLEFLSIMVSVTPRAGRSQGPLLCHASPMPPLHGGVYRRRWKKRLNSVVANTTKQGYLPPCQPSIDDICMRIDLKFCRSILSNPHHVLHQLLPPVRQTHHNRRPRAHDRSIPDIKDSVFRKTFIIQMIYHNF